MAKFTILTRQDIENILGRYHLGTLRSFTPMAGGLANSSVKILTESGSYVLSVCDEKEMDEIKLLCSVLGCLEQYDFPTTRVVETRNGELSIDYQGKPLYVKQFIAGEVVEKLSAEQLWGIGEVLASLHEIPPCPGLLQYFSYGIESFDELKGRSPAASFYNILSSFRKRLDAARSEPLPKGFVHGDLFFDNILFANGSLVALLDFEEACDYYKIFDLGMTAVGCCTPDRLFSLEMTAALVEGYQSRRRLEDGERRLLQLHVEYGALATSFWRYRQYNIRNPDSQMRNHYLAMVEIARQVQSIDSQEFIESVFRKSSNT
ncbi:MAG: homoserine kinase [Desulfofustis sp.]|nr:homoserine kinase [Desulfofustis sp.]